MQVTLTVISGPHQGREFSFEEHSNFIAGRSKKAQFRLPRKDQYFSRTHFLIELNPPLCRILDLESRNGTFVNGQRIKTAELKESDLIEAGETVIRVAIIRSPEDIAAESSSPPVDRADEPAPQQLLAEPTLVPRNGRRPSQPAVRPQDAVVASAPVPDPYATTDVQPQRLPRLPRRNSCHRIIVRRSPDTLSRLSAIRWSMNSDAVAWVSCIWRSARPIGPWSL